MSDHESPGEWVSDADARREFEQMLRADRAELSLRDAQKKLAEVLAMADWLEEYYYDRGVKATVVAAAIRRAVRGIEYAQ